MVVLVGRIVFTTIFFREAVITVKFTKAFSFLFIEIAAQPGEQQRPHQFLHSWFFLSTTKIFCRQGRRSWAILHIVIESFRNFVEPSLLNQPSFTVYLVKKHTSGKQTYSRCTYFTSVQCDTLLLYSSSFFPIQMFFKLSLPNVYCFICLHCTCF